MSKGKERKKEGTKPTYIPLTKTRTKPPIEHHTSNTPYRSMKERISRIKQHGKNKGYFLFISGRHGIIFSFSLFLSLHGAGEEGKEERGARVRERLQNYTLYKT